METKTKTALTLVQESTNELTQLAMLNYDNQSEAQQVVLQELEYLREHAMNTPAIMECVPASIAFAVRRAIKNNQTLDPQAGLMYVKTRNVNVGTKDAPKWVKVMETQETANGKISRLRQLGRILDIKRPMIEHDANGKVISVTCEYQLSTGRWESATFTAYEFERWEQASAKQNNGKANAMYTSWKGGIDPEFARAKSIQHSLKKLGANPNEKLAKAIQKMEPIQIIEQSANLAEADDQQEPGGQYMVTTHEIVSTDLIP